MNKKQRINRILMSVCLAVLFLFCAAIAVRFFTRQVLIVGLGMRNAFTDAVFFDNVDMQRQPGYQASVYGDTDDYSVDWSQEYPFRDSADQPAENTEESSDGVLSRYTGLLNTLKGRIEDYAQNNLVGYTYMTELGNAYENLVGWNFSSYSEYNGIYQLPDGYWTSLKARKSYAEHIASFASLHDFCQENGSRFLYIQAPYKVSKYDDPTISGVVDFSNQNADELLAGLEAQGIATFDLRTVIKEEELEHHELFYRTDHHWKGETGLWAAGKIAEHLNANYGYQIDTQLLDPDRFDTVTYPEYFLGSLGRKVTLGKADPEDFSLLYPTYDTLLHFEIPSIGIDITGDFSVTYNMEAVDGIDYYNKDPYHANCYGDRAIIRIENLTDVQETKKVLLIHDSFSDCVISFLSLGLKDLEALDLRYFNGSLETYLEQSKPDIVIVMYNAGELVVDVDMTTHTNLYDFR